MSNASLHPERTAHEHDATDPAADVSARVRSELVRRTRAVGFWSAIALPFLYLPVLATGLQSMTETWAVLALLALNLVALVLGRSYRRD